MCIERSWMIVLENCSAKMIVRNVRVGVKRFVVVRVTHKHCFIKKVFGFLVAFINAFFHLMMEVFGLLLPTSSVREARICERLGYMLR